MDDDNKHLERQQQQQHIQHPPMQQPLAEVNNHQQPVEGLENEVKEDVDEFKPEELQMKVDPVGTGRLRIDIKIACLFRFIGIKDRFDFFSHYEPI